MFRLFVPALIAVAALVGCGSVITISVPNLATGAGAPLGYERLFSPAPHAFRFAAKGEPVRRGRTSERFELRDGDCGGSDCGNPWYRSEIREDAAKIRAEIGTDIWYGWSFYNQNIASVPPEDALGLVIGQWKLSGEQPPVFRLVQTGLGEGNWASCDPAICSRDPDRTLDVVAQLEDMRLIYNWGSAQNDGEVCKLFSMGQNLGKWVDIVVNTNFSSETNGYLRIWVNGVQKCNYFGRLVADPAARKGLTGPSHRRGIYASHTQRWNQNRPGQPKPTLIAFYDEFFVGSTREDVDTRLREAAMERPKD